LFDLFRSFLPFENPIGFGASDFIELTLAALLVLLSLLCRPWIEPQARRLGKKTVWCMALFAALPVALRLALLPHHPVPSPDVYDEFSHLLTADTLLHFRLANPLHPLHQFFETFYVLQEPSYSSIYVIGQGAVLAFGRLIFGHPWAGVVLSVAAFCALCFWMLRGWTTPGWALVGGALAVIQFGPLNEWMNGYWGGAVSAAAGCLVFGALPRLRNGGGTREAALLGLGLAIQLLTRPYEFIFLFLGALLFFVPAFRILVRAAPVVLLATIPAVAITLLQNKRATGEWTTPPYLLSRYQYGVPTTFTVQPNPIPHRALTPQQETSYRSQVSYHGESTDTLRRFFERLEYRVRFYRFFFLPSLYLALLFFLPALRDYKFLWILLTLLLFAIGCNFYPFFFPHYIAAVTCLFVLMSVIGLQRLSQWRAGQEATRLIVILCIAHFVFWYGLHVFDDKEFSLALRRFETWDAINHRNPERRIAINQELAQIPGKLLVFVRYAAQHPFQDEWIYNAADIDGARIVWARDLGEPENTQLRGYYPDRTVMLLDPDFRPPRLGLYQPER
jgi:hypothetical protein